MAHVLIVGCGYVGTALGLRLAAEQHVVWGLRRDVSKLPVAFKPVEADLTVPRTLSRLPQTDIVVFAAAPDRSDNESYAAIYLRGLEYTLAALEHSRHLPRRVFMISSTSVYGQSQGEWVDETSDTTPTQSSGQILLQSEALLRASGLPYTILRAGGIYGPTRTRLLTKVREGKATYPTDMVQYTNRIHRDDCAGALHHLMGLRNPDSLYIGVDSDPTDLKTVLTWLAAQLNASSPQALPSTSSARNTNKRCCNDKLLETGYTLRYPSFRDGYRAMLLQMKL